MNIIRTQIIKNKVIKQSMKVATAAETLSLALARQARLVARVLCDGWPLPMTNSLFTFTFHFVFISLLLLGFMMTITINFFTNF